jgi:CYTH domain-containing protein
MTELEIELTYLARELPADLAGSPSKQIVDVYYPAEAEHPVVRVRQRGDVYEITKKMPIEGVDSSHQTEDTIPLNAQEFAALTKNPGKRVAKRRYFYKYQGHVAEIDVFQEDLSGLVEVDFEFKNRQVQDAFTMPAFCLADVTQEEIFAGGVLAGKKYADIAGALAAHNYKPLYIETKE